VNAVEARCDVVAGLVSRWHFGTMRAVDREAYEQHLLFCPPCLVQNDKARLSFAALADVPTVVPPQELVDGLTAMVAAPEGG
jgi:hypothetical protein